MSAIGFGPTLHPNMGGISVISPRGRKEGRAEKRNKSCVGKMFARGSCGVAILMQIDLSPNSEGRHNLLHISANM